MKHRSELELLALNEPPLSQSTVSNRYFSRLFQTDVRLTKTKERKSQTNDVNIKQVSKSYSISTCTYSLHRDLTRQRQISFVSSFDKFIITDDQKTRFFRFQDGKYLLEGTTCKTKEVTVYQTRINSSVRKGSFFFTIFLTGDSHASLLPV